MIYSTPDKPFEIHFVPKSDLKRIFKRLSGHFSAHFGFNCRESLSNNISQDIILGKGIYDCDICRKFAKMKKKSTFWRSLGVNFKDF